MNTYQNYKVNGSDMF